MPLVFHPLVSKDVRAVLRYYEDAGGISLADRFFAELEALVADIDREPRRFRIVLCGIYAERTWRIFRFM